MLAFFIWGPNFRNKKTLLRIDNQAFVYIIDKRTSKSKRVMVWLKFKANHIEGSHNKIAESFTISGTPLQESGPKCRPSTSRYTSGILECDLRIEVNNLMSKAMAPSTHKTYLRGFEFFNTFRNTTGLDNVWPIPVLHLVEFIVYMNKLKFAHSTILCYISGISYFNKLNDTEDNTTKFIIRKLIEGVKRSNPSQFDNRLPIIRDMLGGIIGCLSSVCKNNFETKLFRAVFSLVFHGFFRVGELTTTSKQGALHTILLHNVRIEDNKIVIFLKSSKTDQFGHGTTISICKQPNTNLCPVLLMSQYLKERPNYPGPLFCHFEGSALTRYQFSAILKKCFVIIGIESDKFKSHSFRIGIATICAIDGMPDEQIKQRRCWESNVYLRYIRI